MVSYRLREDAQEKFPRHCAGCNQPLGRTVFLQHRKYGCSIPKTVTEYSEPPTVGCPNCEGSFRTQRLMVEHYHKIHSECLSSKKIVPSFKAVEVLVDDIKGKTGLGLACDKSNETIKIYRCSGRKMTDFQGQLKTCTAFVHATKRNDGQIDVDFCETHSHLIQRSYVTYPLAALEITEKMADERYSASEIAQAIRETVREIPEESMNFNHMSMSIMTTSKVCKYLYSRKKRHRKRKYRFLSDHENSENETSNERSPPQPKEEEPQEELMPELGDHDYLRTAEDRPKADFVLPKNFVLPTDSMTFEDELVHLEDLPDDVKQHLEPDFSKLKYLNTMLQEARQKVRKRYGAWYFHESPMNLETSSSMKSKPKMEHQSESQQLLFQDRKPKLEEDPLEGFPGDTIVKVESTHYIKEEILDD